MDIIDTGAGKSGAQKAVENVAALRFWIAERKEQQDVIEYIRGGKLNRSEIAKELGFSRSVFAQNPLIKKLIEECDIMWCSEDGIQTHTRPLREANAARERAVTKAKRSEGNNSKLLERVIELEAENRQLKLQLSELETYKTAREMFVELSGELKNLYG